MIIIHQQRPILPVFHPPRVQSVLVESAELDLKTYRDSVAGDRTCFDFDLPLAQCLVHLAVVLLRIRCMVGCVVLSELSSATGLCSRTSKSRLLQGAQFLVLGGGD